MRDEKDTKNKGQDVSRVFLSGDLNRLVKTANQLRKVGMLERISRATGYSEVKEGTFDGDMLLNITNNEQKPLS